MFLKNYLKGEKSMSKKEKIWTIFLSMVFVVDVIMHFIAYGSVGFALHLNYISSVLMAFTIGLWLQNIPGLKDDKDE